MQNGMIPAQPTPHNRPFFVPTSNILFPPFKSGKTHAHRLVGRQVCRLRGRVDVWCFGVSHVEMWPRVFARRVAWPAAPQSRCARHSAFSPHPGAPCRPAEKFAVFDLPFFQDHPHFLSLSVPIALSCAVAGLGMCFLNESHPRLIKRSPAEDKGHPAMVVPDADVAQVCPSWRSPGAPRPALIPCAGTSTTRVTVPFGTATFVAPAVRPQDGEPIACGRPPSRFMSMSQHGLLCARRRRRLRIAVVVRAEGRACPKGVSASSSHSLGVR